MLKCAEVTASFFFNEISSCYPFFINVCQEIQLRVTNNLRKVFDYMTPS